MGGWGLIATVALAARYTGDVAAVALGARLAKMLANVPAVFLGNKIAQELPMRLVHGIAAAIFVMPEVQALLKVGNLF